MNQRESFPVRFAVCIDNAGYPASLELHKIYRVVPDNQVVADRDIQVIDESGEDYLYPAARFAEIDLPQLICKLILCAA